MSMNSPLSLMFKELYLSLSIEGAPYHSGNAYLISIAFGMYLLSEDGSISAIPNTKDTPVAYLRY